MRHEHFILLPVQRRALTGQVYLKINGGIKIGPFRFAVCNISAAHKIIRYYNMYVVPIIIVKIVSTTCYNYQ